MLCALATCVLWFAAAVVPALAERPEWPLLLRGPGAGWRLHVGNDRHALQDRSFSGLVAPAESGGGRVLAPNMNKVIAGRQIDRQMYAHFAGACAAAGSSRLAEWFSYPAGLALVLANAWLLRNLLTAVAFYRRQRLKIEA
jgi:hypothetical protein